MAENEPISPLPKEGVGPVFNRRASAYMQEMGVGMFDAAPLPARRTRRSLSAPAVRTLYQDDFSMDSPKESIFLKIGDRVSFYSEKDEAHGFVSTLG